MSDFGTVEMIFSNTLKEKIFNNFSYGSSNESTCEDNTCNVKINIYLGEDNEFKIEKDNIKINRIGISIDSFGYADINIGENYTPTFRSYSGDVTWSSSDSSIAKVDANTGVVTAVASGAVLITGKTSDNMKNSYVLRVKPNDAYKSKFQSDFNEIMKDRDTIVLPAISSLEVDNNDYIYMLINTEINKLIKNYDKKYVMHVKETSAGKVTIEMGSTYEFNTIDEYQSVEYCQTYDESNGFNCGSTTKELTIKYADQVSGSGYDSTLVNPAKEVLKQLKKKYVVNMNISFKDYLNHPEFVDNYDFVKDANIGKLLNNPKGFEIGIDGRAGDSSFENALVNGYPLVIKNGITYASSEEPFTISRTLVVNGKANDSEENKIANIKATVLKTLDSTDKVDVKRNEDGTYNIVITKNSINSTSQNLLNSNYTVKSLLTTVNSNSVRYLASEGNSIEFNTYVSFKTVSTKPSIAKLSISKGNNNSLKLTWNSVDGATKYYIYRSTNKSSGYKKIKVVTTNEYINTGLTYGKTYYYKIVSANSNGSSKYSNIVAKKVVPNKVENLKYVSSTDSYIKLSFNKVNTTGYELYRSTNNKTWTKVATLTKNNILTYVNKKLRANKNYYYKVRAYKTVSGRKIYGSFSTTVKMLTAPSVPKIKVSLKSYKSLNIKIYESTSASKYLVYRSTSKTGKYSLVKELTTFGSFVEDDLVTGSTYYYKVRSCNIFDSCSSYSSAVSKKVTPGVPTFSVYAVDKKLNQIGISLIDGVNGFEVYRSTKKTSGYKKIFDVPIEVSLNPAISGKSGVTYYFKLRSYKTVNGKKVYSSFSSYKKVKTK